MVAWVRPACMSGHGCMMCWCFGLFLAGFFLPPPQTSHAEGEKVCGHQPYSSGIIAFHFLPALTRIYFGGEHLVIAAMDKEG